MCTGRVDLSFILRAFRKGADGVIIGGCWLGECHYVTEGNYDALGNVRLMRKLMQRVGLNPQRLRIEWISASEGTRFAEVMTDFVARTRELGPLGRGEGMDEAALEFKLESIRRIVPYLKLVERERLRVPHKSEQAYDDLYSSEGLDRLFGELVADKLAMSQMMMLLGQGPLSKASLCERLGLGSSEVSRHVGSASRQGLVRYDSVSNCFALA